MAKKIKISYANGGDTDNKVLNYKENKDYFDSRAVLHDNARTNDWIKKQVYSGKFGYNPSTKEVVPLSKSKQTTVSPTVKRMGTDPAYQEEKIEEGLRKPQEMSKDEITEHVNAGWQNPLMYGPGLLFSGAAAPALGTMIGLGQSGQNVSEGNYGEAALDFALSGLPIRKPIVRAVSKLSKPTIKKPVSDKLSFDESHTANALQTQAMYGEQPLLRRRNISTLEDAELDKQLWRAERMMWKNPHSGIDYYKEAGIDHNKMLPRVIRRLIDSAADKKQFGDKKTRDYRNFIFDEKNPKSVQRSHDLLTLGVEGSELDRASKTVKLQQRESPITNSSLQRRIDMYNEFISHLPEDDPEKALFLEKMNKAKKTGSNEFLQNTKPYKGKEAFKSISPYSKGGKASYENGGSSYGIVPGNGDPKADDLQMKVKEGHVVPAENTHIAMNLLESMGYNPHKNVKMDQNGGTDINISSGEYFMNKEQVRKLKQNGINPEVLSPNSPYNKNIGFANGGESNEDDEDNEEESDPNLIGMMKARMAYANEFGNPAGKRMVSPNPKTYDFGDGKTGTHYMASWDNYAVPQIQEENGQMVLGDFGPESNEAMEFDRPEDAEYFAKHYKEIAPMMKQFKTGGKVNITFPKDQNNNQQSYSDSFQAGGETEDPKKPVSSNDWKTGYKDLHGDYGVNAYQQSLGTGFKNPDGSTEPGRNTEWESFKKMGWVDESNNYVGPASGEPVVSANQSENLLSQMIAPDVTDEQFFAPPPRETFETFQPKQLGQLPLEPVDRSIKTLPQSESKTTEPGMATDPYESFYDETLARSKKLTNAETLANLGMMGHNWSKERSPIPKPQLAQVREMTRDYEVMKNEAKKDITKQSASTMYKLRNLGMTGGPMVGVDANEKEAILKAKASIWDLQGQDSMSNINSRNQQMMDYAGKMYDWGLRESAAAGQFASEKGANIAQNVGQIFSTQEAGLNRETQLKSGQLDYSTGKADYEYDQQNWSKVMQDKPAWEALKKKHGITGNYINRMQWRNNPKLREEVSMYKSKS